MALDFSELAKIYQQRSNAVQSAGQTARKQLIQKLKYEEATNVRVTVGKVLSFDFNPFNVKDPDKTYDANNPFKVADLPSVFIKMIGRTLYHTNEDYKEKLDNMFERVPEQTKMLFECKTLEIPEDPSSPITNSEIAVYAKYSDLYTFNGVFRNIKSGKYKKTVLDPTNYSLDEDNMLTPLEDNIITYLGSLENALARKNAVYARNFVETDKDWITKSEDKKAEYIGNASYGSSIISAPRFKSVLPVIAFTLDPSSGVKPKDNTIDFKSMEGMSKTISYIQDPDFIKQIKEAIGTPRDRNTDMLFLEVSFPLVDAPKSQKMLAIYKAKSITVSPDWKLEAIVPTFVPLIEKFYSYSYYEEELAKGTPPKEIKSIHSEYFKANSYAFKVLKPESLVQQYSASRNARDFARKFNLDELDELSNALKIAGINLKDIQITEDVDEVIEGVLASEKDTNELEQKVLAELDALPELEDGVVV